MPPTVNPAGSTTPFVRIRAHRRADGGGVEEGLVQRARMGAVTVTVQIGAHASSEI